MKTYQHSDNQLPTYANAGDAIASDQVVVVSGIVGIAANSIAATTGVGPLQLRGCFQVTKAASQAWTQGQRVYWDAGNSCFTSAVTAVYAGVAARAAASAADDTTGYVMLNAGASANAVLSQIADTNGNELVKFTATTSAVNEITLANAATAGAPTITASGGDTNIGITIVPKGTGAITLQSKAQIGTAAASLVGFFGSTPASQAAVIAASGLTAATQATTTEVRALSVAVDALVALVKTYGLAATA